MKTLVPALRVSERVEIATRLSALAVSGLRSVWLPSVQVTFPKLYVLKGAPLRVSVTVNGFDSPGAIVSVDGDTDTVKPGSDEEALMVTGAVPRFVIERVTVPTPTMFARVIEARFSDRPGSTPL